ncbi:D-arabinose 1-dehydrogenase (NAD(P)(+)), partial [Turnera subulata]
NISNSRRRGLIYKRDGNRNREQPRTRQLTPISPTQVDVSPIYSKHSCLSRASKKILFAFQISRILLGFFDHNNHRALSSPYISRSPPTRAEVAITSHRPSQRKSAKRKEKKKMRIEESEGVSASRKHLVFAYYVTGHGFGHATRVVEVVRNLILAGHDVHVVTGAPDFVFTSEVQSPRLFIRKVLLDCGAVQADALTVDRLASLEKYSETAVIPRESILETEIEWLNSIKADLVVSDVVPVACRAAADAGIRSVCVTNFSWDFIYAEYVMAAGLHHRSIVWQIAEDYSHCEFLIRLPGYCPMPAFRDVIDVPLVVRRLHKSRKEIRKELGISEDVKLVILNFGGQPSGWKLKEEYLPSGWLCLVAAHILQETAIGKNYASDKLSGVRRLRDAIVLGYQLQRVPGRDISIPEWYASAENELSKSTGTSPTAKANGNSTPISSPWTEDFEIVRGDLQGLSDTMSFLKSLGELDAIYESEKIAEKRQLRERKAAAGLFNWEEDIVVARAPGRLDVMGGIADYSGSLVLQMPIREACHVAAQRNHPSKHRLWKHGQARQNAKGQGPTPVLQIVSYGSELSNRSPTFDMDLSDFMDDGVPITYEKARKYFAQDPSQKWAAYVAGVILVLMTELGVRFEDSISLLVSSAVPEGKGVSSSASIEVATMSAIAAAHGLSISPRDIALLCQKVENHIVGAPCGVMDQMTSACGEANKLLAMVCQPAEVIGLVEIPSHIRVWGIDSGIRHSVGGADYGSVRIGAFMGRKMIKSLASAVLSRSAPGGDGFAYDELEDDSVNLLKAEASLDYLCNLPPHRYEALYSKMLPKSILGEEFLEKYADHNDPVTVIDQKRLYAVTASAKHPIYENFRVKAFKALLTSASSDEQLTALGELLYQCHYSYSACGLGSDGTDRLVRLVQEMQHSKSASEDGTLYGAKITGGGSGGTVCVIGTNCTKSSQQIFEIQERYKDGTGYLPFIFEGSSPGAGKFGYLRIRRRISPRPS